MEKPYLLVVGTGEVFPWALDNGVSTNTMHEQSLDTVFDKVLDKDLVKGKILAHQIF